MLTRSSLTIRLHPERRRRDRAHAARRRHQAARREGHGLRPRPARPQGRHARDQGGRAGAPLQPDHRLREPRHRARRARAPQQPRDGRVRARLRVRRRRQADAVRRAAGDVHGHRPRRRPRGDAQLHRHPVDGELLGHGRPRHRRPLHARAARRVSERRRRRRADARLGLRHGHARARACSSCGARSAATRGTRTSPAC